MTRIGIGLSGGGGMSAADVLRTALAAAQDSRKTGDGWASYNRSTDLAHRRGFRLLADFPRALQAADQLNLRFQPKYQMRIGRITGAEALLRWTHPELGPISPAEFIPLVENTAYMEDLTALVVARGIEVAAGWQRRRQNLRIAINISPNNLVRPGFAAHFVSLAARGGVDPARFEFEFTESALVSDDTVVIAELRALRDCGSHIALDDFGTGFSNFSYIGTLPVDIIKIDKSFIQKICAEESTAIVVRALIQMAHRLGYMVVAEGIETAETYRLLATWRCDEGQGFHMSEPLTLGDFEKLLSRSRVTAGAVRQQAAPARP